MARCYLSDLTGGEMEPVLNPDRVQSPGLLTTVLSSQAGEPGINAWHVHEATRWPVRRLDRRAGNWVWEVNRGHIPYSIVSHQKDVSSYSEWDEKLPVQEQSALYL